MKDVYFLLLGVFKRPPTRTENKGGEGGVQKSVCTRLMNMHYDNRQQQLHYSNSNNIDNKILFGR